MQPPRTTWRRLSIRVCGYKGASPSARWQVCVWVCVCMCVSVCTGFPPVPAPSADFATTPMFPKKRKKSPQKKREWKQSIYMSWLLTCNFMAVSACTRSARPRLARSLSLSLPLSRCYSLTPGLTSPVPQSLPPSFSLLGRLFINGSWTAPRRACAVAAPHSPAPAHRLAHTTM